MVLHHWLDVYANLRLSDAEPSRRIREHFQQGGHAVERGLEKDGETAAAQSVAPVCFAAGMCGFIEQLHG